MSDSPYNAAEWATICEQINECDEPPIRRCPQCSGLCYEVGNVYHCSTCGEVPVAHPARINSSRMTRFADEAVA